MKYQELQNRLEIGWHKKSDNYLKFENEAYTLLETFKGNDKLISHIV